MMATRRASALWTTTKRLSACGAAFVLLSSGAAAAEPTLSIEARLFGAKTGRFSKNVLAPDPPRLGDVISGENASTSTFVIVRVASDQPLAKTARVRLVANGASRADGQRRPGFATGRLLDSAVFLPPVGPGTIETHVGFWLPDTGCLPIALKAELLDPPRRPVSAAARLEFRCGG